MSLARPADPSHLPLNVLFPEQYEASKRMIVRDFALLGGLIVGSVLLAASIHLAALRLTG
ncbi:MAG TPA: hypothetical protein VFH78_11260 [Candidatus Thermoplasmatota archaeon]|nr:hypothetical protein [Candidatus Thermoplasmatota archaeon]